MANPGNVIGGYKATLNNPNVGEEANSLRTRPMLRRSSRTSSRPVRCPRAKLPPARMRRRTPAMLSAGTRPLLSMYTAHVYLPVADDESRNPNMSEEAKEHSSKVLEDLGA
jgi:hypothetical protein